MFDRSYTSNAVQAALMQTLLATHPTLISREELRREHDNAIAVDDALAYLARLGLVHQIENDGGQEFFWATRTAMAGEEATTAIISTECETT
jgi:prephenate dehydrogenase